MLDDDEIRRWLLPLEFDTFNVVLSWPASDAKSGCISAFRSLAESRSSFSRFSKDVQEACGMEGTALSSEHVIDHVRALRAKADGVTV